MPRNPVSLCTVPGIDEAPRTATRTRLDRAPITRGSATMERIAALFLQLNSIAVRLDRAVAERGHGDYSGNSAIGAMTLLSLDGPQRPKELAAKTNLSSGGLTLLLKRLEHDGVVTVDRGGLPSDRRAAIASLTPRGERVVAEISDCVEHTIETIATDVREVVELVHTIGASRAIALPPVTSGVHRMWLMAGAGNEVARALADPAFPSDPTPATTALVLCGVAHAGHTRPSDLVPVVALSPSGVTQLLDRIEHAGLVTRDAGLTGDRREVTIGLTPAGEHSLAIRLERLAARAGQLVAFLDAVRSPLRDD